MEAGPPADALSDALFRALYEAHFSYVFNTLRRLGVREGDLEDVAHEVFVTAHRRRESWDRSSPIRAWLAGISTKKASDYRQLARHRREVHQEADVIDDRPDPEADLDAAQERQLVLRGLERLSMDRRAVIVMHDIDELPMPAIARELAIPLNTAYSRLRLARADFAAAVRHLQRQDAP